jgi:predicted DNA-binding transcriptional regulator AlpA
MSSDQFSPLERPRSIPASRPVVLSPWVNERFPAWPQLLSAHDVARLTRRPSWLLLSMVMLGRFPRRARFHGRAIGWLRSDVQRWLVAKSCPATHLKTARARRPSIAGQITLPLGRACAGRRVKPQVDCSLCRSRRS